MSPHLDRAKPYPLVLRSLWAATAFSGTRTNRVLLCSHFQPNGFLVRLRTVVEYAYLMKRVNSIFSPNELKAGPFSSFTFWLLPDARLARLAPCHVLPAGQETHSTPPFAGCEFAVVLRQAPR